MPEKGALSKIANKVFSLETLFKVVIWGIAINFFLFGAMDFGLYHNNLGGKAFVQAFDPIVQSFYDTFGITDLFTSLATLIGGPEVVASVKNTFMGNIPVPPPVEADALDLISE